MYIYIHLTFKEKHNIVKELSSNGKELYTCKYNITNTQTTRFTENEEKKEKKKRDFTLSALCDYYLISEINK